MFGGANTLTWPMIISNAILDPLGGGLFWCSYGLWSEFENCELV